MRIAEVAASDAEPDYHLELLVLPDHDELRPYERALVEQVFAGGHSVLLSEAKDRFAKAVPAFQKEVYEEATRAGLFKDNPEKVRHRYRLYGGSVFMAAWLALCASISGGFFLAAASYADVVYLLLPGFSVFMLGLGLTLLSYAMPARTTTGSVAAARWRSFRAYLADIEQSPDFEQDPGVLKRYLSYAVAFGLGKTWVDRFATGDVQVPAWYGNSTSSARLWGLDSAMPGSSASTPDGSGVSGSGISELGTLLDQASSAFSSGFNSGSGGGFSGGGGGGSSGGGSGGGSAGFS